MFTNRLDLDKAQSYDAGLIGWIYLLSIVGHFDTDRPRTPRVNWPYDDVRDTSLARLPNDGGYPTCREWWSDPEIWLRDHLMN